MRDWLLNLVLPKRCFTGSHQERRRSLRRYLWLWVGVVLLAHVLLLFLGRDGVAHSDIRTAHDVMGWTLAKQLLYTSLALYVVWVTERMHRTQAAEMKASNAELERLHQTLIRTQAHKDEFMASVGHELRTPMNAILGLNGVLRRELMGRPEEVVLVDHIRRSTEQLLQVVNDLLDFSQLQAGRLTLHPEAFALHDTLSAALASYEEKAREKNVALLLQADAVQGLWVQGDRQRLEQVLKHLLDNALKFTAQGSICLRAQPVDEGVLFEVQDTGMGIAPERQPHIFQGLAYADAQTHRPYGGTGLGLALCERLVRLQGGTIGVSSALGQGARFWFQLPLRSVAGQEAQAAADMARLCMDKPLRLLLVDDNAVNRLVARMMLNQCFPKADIVEASSGAMALEQLKTQTFDITLMDMVMPEMDGMQATRMLRRDLPAPACHMPVLALTASANPADQARCLESGMNGVVHKPLDPAQLMAKISSALAAHAEWGRT
ncbi:MAG: Aerobic respiration control sensor protein ArcB [Pseudomonadota bacterium]